MTGKRRVFIDPAGAHDDWLYVLVEAPTGVTYQQQYGGTAMVLGSVEGFLVPVFNHAAVAELRLIFERDFGGAGLRGLPLPEGMVELMRNIVAEIEFWYARGEEDWPERLRLDETRLGELDEAWIPVLTSEGRGMLVWPNSD